MKTDLRQVLLIKANRFKTGCNPLGDMLKRKVEESRLKRVHAGIPAYITVSIVSRTPVITEPADIVSPIGIVGEDSTTIAGSPQDLGGVERCSRYHRPLVDWLTTITNAESLGTILDQHDTAITT